MWRPLPRFLRGHLDGAFVVQAIGQLVDDRFRLTSGCDLSYRTDRCVLQR